MKKYFILISLSLCIMASSAQAQRSSIRLYDNLNLYAPSLVKLYNQVKTSKVMDVNEYETIKGSPYIHKYFEKGFVISKDSLLYSGLMLRYNNYKDIIEFKKDDLAYELSNQFPLLYVKIKDKIYERLVFKTKEGEKLGYFQIQSDGKVTLYSKASVLYVKAKPASGYVEYKPPKFKQEPISFYLKQEGSTNAILIDNKKDLINVLYDKKEEVLAFMNVNKLKASKLEDITRIINYYNELN
ncbi:hypothetical protein [Marinifilum caeruleilacunae]|uniref:GLPGLI family protein n=1 Tax=Marinifilum caeruleilacunae TaxID=2499076 RepID=A0ABX1X0A2_9BACT|nr:hypothetical protein [Marinifilum caeruleilacunae]NOU61734.1 hypothetical protein [Marinifilum caeruleilacunae]